MRGQAQLSNPNCYKYLFELHPLPAWIYDPKTLKILAANRAALAERGCIEEDFLQMRVSDVYPGNPKIMLALAEFAGGPPGSVEISGSGAFSDSGSVLSSMLAHSHDLNAEGGGARVLIVQDLGEKKRLEKDLRLLAAAVASSSESMLITDANWNSPGPKIEFVNPAFAAMTGYSESELLGRSPAILQGPKTESVPLRRIQADLQAAGFARYRSINYRKDGSEYLSEWQVTPVREESGAITHLLSLQRDVTEEARICERMQQAQKMEAIGRLAGGVAHDFNNLLTIILGYAGLLSVELSKSFSVDEKQFRSLHEIQKASEKAAALTGQLLAFSRKQPPVPRIINLNLVIRNMESMLQRLIGEDVDLAFHLQSDLGPVQADSGQLEQLLMNLVVNARDAMPEGGMLTVETCNTEITARHAPVTSIKPGHYVVLSVTDTGIGMDEGTRARVFEPFFTTKEPGRGTGLGLASAYSFVNQCGGHILVSSKPGLGACFKIYLPRVNSAVQTAGASVEVTPRRGSGVILVVEDESGIRELIRELLDGAGYQVFTAANGQDAMNFVAGHDGPIDLLLTDVVLPGTSGPDLADSLKALRPGLRVLFASGYSDHALLRKGTLETGAAFMQKPFDTRTILACVGGLLGSESANTQAQ